MTKTQPNVAELLKEYLDADIPAGTLEKLKEIVTWETFEANDIIYREHEDSVRLFLVHSGQVDIQYLMPNARRETVDTCVKGDFLVWSALIKPYKTNSIGICRAKSELLAFDGAKLRALCDSDHHFGYLMMRHIAGVVRRRLQAARAEIVDLRD